MQQMDKKALRQSLKVRRSALSYAYVEESSTQLVAHILATESYQKAQSVMAYLAFGNEPNLDMLIEAAWREGKELYVPYCIDTVEHIMVPVRLDSWEELELDGYGIRIPKKPLTIGNSDALELILVPGLSFDKEGGRLGLGAGYYDRFLPTARGAIQMGICLERMLYDGTLPMDSFDYYVENVVTEKGFVK